MDWFYFRLRVKRTWQDAYSAGALGTARGIQYLHCIMSKHKNIHTQVTWSKLGGVGTSGFEYLQNVKFYLVREQKSYNTTGKTPQTLKPANWHNHDPVQSISQHHYFFPLVPLNSNFLLSMFSYLDSSERNRTYVRNVYLFMLNILTMDQIQTISRKPCVRA